MTLIAHLTDPHLLEPSLLKRCCAERARLSFLSFGRPLDPARRRDRMKRALAAVRASGADHLLITGDLTEDGTDEQFEVLADVLAESRIAPERITLVPGNHDAYADERAWERAIEGPLAAYRQTSRTGVAVALRDVVIVPMSTTLGQPYVRSAGRIDAESVGAVEKLTKDSRLGRAPLIIAQHHPPHPHWLPIAQWVDGLAGHDRMTRLLESSPWLFVVHGHTHRASDRRAGSESRLRVFCGDALVEAESPLRLYDANANGFCPVPPDPAAPIGECLAMA